MTWAELKYHQTYVQLKFERKGLFELVSKELGDRKIIYPGSSIHITPSFFFSNVTFIDQSDVTEKFFSHEQDILKIINGQKHYQKEPIIKFILADFTLPIALPRQSFDLAISLYSGKLPRHIQHHLQPKAYLLTGTTFSAGNQEFLSDWNLLEKITVRDGVYQFDAHHEGKKKGKRSAMKNINNKLVYDDHEAYFLYQLKY